eukprot:CAMPEP_0183303824 /NCGR_PEP_ID=MMETSP0160_2-20130417/9130_1 /TAXON_ID=2839 ORGANISM="Odontella Sinensis, Strain Grunow 1884" /NCGR_SAMPLE_ID=MMETSP0160_2 /ASSEMBLY_ACC=CAM_ASM_000250 /LENGTH=165 /DNA_ID=CAMNT_0025466783 /DNA_START=1 /DNA_END=494 /DNA_ORIENTATION=+
MEARKREEEVLGMPHVTLEAVEKIMADVQSEARDMEARKREEEAKEERADGEEGEESLAPLPEVDLGSPLSVYDTVEASVKYRSYATRQKRDMESWRRARGARIPPEIVYDRASLPTLKAEELEKLEAARPSTFAEASQIAGLRPGSLVFLYHHVMKKNKERKGA